MQLGMIGLGRMGANMTRRLVRGGHAVTVFARNAGRVRELAADGARGAFSLDELVQSLSPPRAVWLMVPAGDPTEGMVTELATRLDPGDAIVDGGNTFYKDDVRRARMLEPRGVHYVDVGTSGGVWGLERGYSLMIGGAAPIVARLEPIFTTLAPGGDAPAATGEGGTAARGYLHCGPTGAGHFVKMVHNGIEYGLMQAYAEGFDILQTASSATRPEAERYRFDLPKIAEVWRHGSVIGSWLLDLTASALAEDPELAAFSGFVEDSGEGRWTIETAIEQAVSVHVLAASLFARFRSRRDHTFGEKVLSAMRHKFGGHTERPTGG
jgi:6-phosphogluconate dehydrogenase